MFGGGGADRITKKSGERRERGRGGGKGKEKKGVCVPNSVRVVSAMKGGVIFMLQQCR